MSTSTLRSREFPNGDIIRLLELEAKISYKYFRIITIELERKSDCEKFELVRYLSNETADKHSFELPVFRSVYEYLLITPHFGNDMTLPSLSPELSSAIEFLGSGNLYHVAREDNNVRFHFKQHFKFDHPFDLDIRPVLNGSSSIILAIDTANESYQIYTLPEETSIELPMDLIWGKADCQEIRKAIRQMPNVIASAQSIYKHLTRNIL